jgi:hypothetical protein
MSNLPLHLDDRRTQTENGLRLLPNSPTSFVEMTLIWFNLPAAAEVLVRFFDAVGHEVAVKTGSFAAGENHIVLQRADLHEAGLYTYQLESEFGVLRRKLMMY